MIIKVTTPGFSHAVYVKREVNRLKRAGYIVGDTINIKKKFLGLFGEDVSDIHYEFPRQAKL